MKFKFKINWTKKNTRQLKNFFIFHAGIFFHALVALLVARAHHWETLEFHLTLEGAVFLRLKWFALGVVAALVVPGAVNLYLKVRGTK